MALFGKKNKKTEDVTNDSELKNTDTDKSQKKIGETELQGDRNKLSVSGKNNKNAKKVVLIIAFLAVAGSLGGLGLYSFIKSKQQKDIVVPVSDADNAQYQRDGSSNKALTDFLNKESKSLEDTVNEEKNNINNKETENNTPPPATSNAVTLPPSDSGSVLDNDSGSGRDKVLTPAQRRNQGEVLISQKSISAPDSSNSGTTKEAAEEKEGTKSQGDFLQGAHFADGTVGFINNRPFLLSAGTSMPCVLKTKIVTSYPAVVMCQLTKNVYSDDGKNVLVRSGALLLGEQTKVIKQGIARVFVNWSTIKDNNIRTRIDALGADGLGAAGLPAWIDNHFWERFSGAIMLSFIDDALAAAASQASKNNSNGVTVDNTSDSASKMAEIALENSINIPPTAYVNQGEILTVIVPRNIDFSKVYKTE